MRYSSGATTRVTCAVNVVDLEPPSLSLLAPGGLCAYPLGARGAACFYVRELVSASDNCRAGVSVAYRGCAVTVSDGRSGSCYFDAATGRVCVSYPDTMIFAVVARADVTFTATDASGNKSPPVVASGFALGPRAGPQPEGCDPR